MSDHDAPDPEPHVLHHDEQGWWDHYGDCPCDAPNDHNRDGSCDAPPRPEPPSQLPVA